MKSNVVIATIGGGATLEENNHDGVVVVCKKIVWMMTMNRIDFFCW